MLTKRFNNSLKKLNPHTAVAPRAVLRDESRSRIFRSREQSLIRSSGSYFLWYRRALESPCHCLNPTSRTGHVNCPTCHGTGFLKSYQKHGHDTMTFSRTWPGMTTNETARFRNGWGWREVLTPNGGPAILTSPRISLRGHREMTLMDVDEFAEFGAAAWTLEFSHDGEGWFNLSREDVDLTMDHVWFRLVLEAGGSRFFRIRFRKDEFTETDLDLPDDTYALVSTEDRYASSTSRERERVDVESETQAWSLLPINAGDFIVDVSGKLNGLRPNGVYLVSALRPTVHETQRSELRREFSLKFIPRNTYAHNLYGVPL